MNPKGVHVNFIKDPTQFTLRETSERTKFIVYIYIRFNRNLDEKSYISAEIEAVKHLYAVFLLTAKERRRPIRL